VFGWVGSDSFFGLCIVHKLHIEQTVVFKFPCLNPKSYLWMYLSKISIVKVLIR
jgi:hypothetical protein